MRRFNFSRLTAHVSLGCAVCFGKSDNPNIVKAFGFGIVILLGCTLAAMVFIAYMFYKIEKHRAGSHANS